MATDLLSRILAELEQRKADLRPLLDEYERLLAAVDTLAAAEAGAASADDSGDTAPASRRTASPRRVRAPRGSAVGTIARAASAPVAAEAPAILDTIDYEPEPERKPASTSDVKQAILAALEHGSHTVGELGMVTAMGPSEIRANLGRLARERKVTRVKRQGDGKSAYALPASSAHA